MTQEAGGDHLRGSCRNAAPRAQALRNVAKPSACPTRQGLTAVVNLARAQRQYAN